MVDSEVFRAGVRPGSPGTEVEVKMLLCYVLSNLEQAISFDQLYDALSEHGLVNYFELVSTLEKLTQTGHIAAGTEPNAPALYSATALGDDTAREFEKSIPFSSRKKALDACRLLLARERRRREVRVSETPCDGGFILELAIPDNGADLLSLRVFAPTRQECDALKRRFLNAPLTVYKGVMALLTGKERVLGQIFTYEESLF